jgi:hypothetical protein
MLAPPNRGQEAPGPLFVLRGHGAAVNYLFFHNSTIFSGYTLTDKGLHHAERVFMDSCLLPCRDAEGAIKRWDLRTRRANLDLKASAGILSLHMFRSNSLLSSGPLLPQLPCACAYRTPHPSWVYPAQASSRRHGGVVVSIAFAPCYSRSICGSIDVNNIVTPRPRQGPGRLLARASGRHSDRGHKTAQHSAACSQVVMAALSRVLCCTKRVRVRCRRSRSSGGSR